MSGCFESEEAEQFYGKMNVPRAQEFRWSDGGVPQIFDPALAVAPPDTDVIRAMYEGLTDYDPRTLKPVAGVATRWESSEDGRRWTFYLRHDARWSNGDPVTARDFVNSWQRTLRMSERAPHAKLLENIEGAQRAVVKPTGVEQGEAAQGVSEERRKAAEAERPETAHTETQPPAFGVEAIDDYTLSVRLQRADKNFPALVAHPVFRPVHVSDASPEKPGVGIELKDFGKEISAAALVTNGAFRLSSRATDSVMLERAKTYWDASAVKLDHVRFVATRNAEDALAAYRAGEVDAVTNAAFEPLAVKLLTSYKDFRRETFGALTYYSFNTERAPFSDQRVREALTVALDLERLSADTLGGATEPAKKFFPPEVEAAGDRDAGDKNSGQRTARREDESRPIQFNAARARQLLTDAGYPGGANFPRIRLLVNRNDQHRLVAQAIAAMWRNVLGVQTEIVQRSWEEYEEMLKTGDYDIARRSMVMQTTDEESNLLALFASEEDNRGAALESVETPRQDSSATALAPDGSSDNSHVPAREGVRTSPAPIMTEAQALRELPAIPIYFASSYALVKPYVTGFDANLLDAPSLKQVQIDTNWKPPPKKATVQVTGIGVP